MRIPEYTDLAEKEAAFGDHYKRIDSIEELKDFLSLDKVLNDNIFRGVCEAKYKNFTSAQRMYMVNDLWQTASIEGLIQKQIESMLTEYDNLLGDYYDSLNIAPNDFLYLGISQHFGGVSPLLDFTHNLNTALFFMTDGAIFPPQGVDDIGNYSSLYYANCNMFNNFNELLKQIASKVQDKINKMAKNNDLSVEIKDNIITFLARFENYKSFDMKVVIPNDNEIIRIPINGKDIGLSGTFSISNLNIVAQQGCFVFYLPTAPLLSLETPLCCIDIHKSLVPYIKEYIKLKKSDIYPNEYEFVKDSYIKALRNILN